MPLLPNTVMLALVASVAITEPDPESPPERREVYIQAPRSFLIPAVETLTFEVGLQLFDRLVLQKSYAEVTLDDVWANIQGGWRFDGDDINVNYIGHAYHGSIVYGAARSSSLSFWESLPYTMGGSFIWELAAEKQEPSINDLVVSGATGAVLGEALHRIARIFVNGDPDPHPLAGIGAFLLEPWGALNRQVFGRKVPKESLLRTPPWRTQLWTGPVLIAGEEQHRRLQVGAGLDFSYGFPTGGESACLDPMEHFDATGIAALGEGRRTVDLFLRGLLLACHSGSESRTTAWGLLTHSDFSTGPNFRLAGLGLGPGGLMELRLSRGITLQGTLGATVMGVAASGPQPLTDFDAKAAAGDAPLLYPSGVGLHTLADVELLAGERGSLRLTGRSWWLLSVEPFTEPGVVQVFALTGTGPRLWRFSPGVRAAWHSHRLGPGFPGDRGLIGLLTLNFHLEGGGRK